MFLSAYLFGCLGRKAKRPQTSKRQHTSLTCEVCNTELFRSFQKTKMGGGIHRSIKYCPGPVLFFNRELRITDHYLRLISESYINQYLTAMASGRSLFNRTSSSDSSFISTFIGGLAHESAVNRATMLITF